MHQSFETPAPPPPPIRALAGDCGDFHLIYTPFWFPGRQGVSWKSRPSHPVPGELSGAVTPWSAVFIFAPHSNFAHIIVAFLTNSIVDSG